MADAESQRQAHGAIFPKLVGGPGGRGPEFVAAHQRGRLMGAMIDAVSRHGYPGTTMRELVTLAGVSKTTFYEHFASKEECFLATFDTIIAELAGRTTAQFSSGSDLRSRYVGALRVVMDLIVEEPGAANLVAVESLALGAPGIAHRDRTARALEAMIRGGLDEFPSEYEVSDRTIRAVAGGIRGVCYRRIRASKSDELPLLVEELVDWGMTYRAPESEAVRRAVAAAAVPVAPPPSDPDEERPGWEEPPDSRLSRRTLTQRERIIRAAARVASESSFQSLSIPAISSAAGVSNQTFYEHFSSKREAFLTVFDEVAVAGLEVSRRAFGDGAGPEAIGSALRALTEHIEANPILSRLVFVELPTAGPVALDRVDAMLDITMSFLEPERAPAGLGPTPSRATLEALTSGVWETIQVEVAEGRIEGLSKLAPELTRLVLMPFGNPGEQPTAR